MSTSDVTDTSEMALQASGCDHVNVACQRRSKIPPFTGVKVHHFGVGEVCPKAPLREVATRLASRSGGYGQSGFCDVSGLDFTVLAAVFKAEAFTVHFQNMDMMG